MGLIFLLLGIFICSVIIYFVGEQFAKTSSNIGDYLRLPRSVKGATFDAVSSSMPELLVALFAVIFFKQFEVGIGTIAGSALFNLLIIPSLCVFFAPVVFKVSKEVITRDAVFYLISVFVLFTLVYYFKHWGLIVSLILLSIYLWYLLILVTHSKKKDKVTKVPTSLSITRNVVMFFVYLVVIGAVTYFLTKFSIDLSTLLGVSPIIIAFSITAAATSVPDTVVSVVNARKGDIDDAASNVFGSNIFDILVGLGLPLLIYITFVGGTVEILFEYMEILFTLLGSTILVLFFFAEDHLLKKRDAIILFVVYLVFLLYVILLSIL